MTKIRFKHRNGLEIQKFTLNLKDQVPTCGCLVHSHSSKCQRPKSARQTARQAQSTSARYGLHSHHCLFIVVYGNF